MSRILSVGIMGLLLTAAPSHALFHVSNIDELDAKAGGDASAQYVQIRMLAPLQNMVAHARLSVFNCDGSFNQVLLELPSNVPNSGAGLRWIAATAAGAAGGITPDFTIPANIPSTCGMVCWGAPGLLPQDPPRWDATDPANYVDCVAYGGFTGTLPAHVTAASPLAPGDGTHSLTRVSNGSDDATDFALACPMPTNNAGQVGSLGACAPLATTTTVMGPTNTTTTVPALPGACQDHAAAAAVRAQIASQCSCAAATKHHAYVKCAAGVVKTAVKLGTLPKDCAGSVRKCAAKSTCGTSGFVTCCRVTAGGQRKCALKPSATACKVPKGGTMCVGQQSSCCDTCTTASCAGPVGTGMTTTTRPHRPPTTTMPGYPYVE